MEMFDTRVPIYLPSLIIKHMQRPYGFRLTAIFKDFIVSIHVWNYQTKNDMLGVGIVVDRNGCLCYKTRWRNTRKSGELIITFIIE
ncbi:hypothetical protein H5410_003111 [Solanum commersonii]|uniref:Uncharacterized protein n=1 Tax=Solanum commersonii TaxID=4109 RepID=A0A9J6B474_SOLCO|nr:hypothetical protein H5410_003111 [Solanum commersonii]